MLWNLECPVGVSKPKRIYVCISMKEIGCNLDCPPKGKRELCRVFKILVGRK